MTKADQQSSTEYLDSLSETLKAINKEISASTSLEEKTMLYKQREDILNRQREEKENQREYQSNREDEERKHRNGFFGVAVAVALGAGPLVVKRLLTSRK